MPARSVRARLDQPARHGAPRRPFETVVLTVLVALIAFAGASEAVARRRHANALNADKIVAAPVVTATPEPVFTPEPPAAPVPTPVAPKPVPTARPVVVPRSRAAVPTAVPPVAAPVQAGPAVRAVLVGIDHAKGRPALAGAVNDATKMRDALVTYGVPADQIVMLLEGAATRSAILNSAARLAQGSQNEPVVFAFAGHGSRGRFTTVEGASITTSDLANVLGRVRAPLWATFLQCYAGSFDVPGISGPGRVTTFASSANELAYESGGQSELGRYMVDEGMVQGNARTSVEAAFNYAYSTLSEYSRDGLPQMNDSYSGELSLGPVSAAVQAS